MTTSALGMIIIVIVVAVGLVVWISAVSVPKETREPAAAEPPAQDPRRDLPW